MKDQSVGQPRKRAAIGLWMLANILGWALAGAYLGWNFDNIGLFDLSGQPYLLVSAVILGAVTGMGQGWVLRTWMKDGWWWALITFGGAGLAGAGFEWLPRLGLALNPWPEAELYAYLLLLVGSILALILAGGLTAALQQIILRRYHQGRPPWIVVNLLSGGAWVASLLFFGYASVNAVGYALYALNDQLSQTLNYALSGGVVLGLASLIPSAITGAALFGWLTPAPVKPSE